MLNPWHYLSSYPSSAPPAISEQTSFRGVGGGSDGDTVTCLTSASGQVKVRLSEIDAPESRQPYCRWAKHALSGLVYRKQVLLHAQGTDRYYRTIARAAGGNTEVTAEMVTANTAATSGYSS